MEKKIEKIYVCKKKEDDSEIIEKVLIQYVDGSSSYFSLPSFYDKEKSNEKSNERDKLEKKLNKFIKKLSKQNNSNLNNTENSKIITVTEGNVELKEYVDYQTDKIYQDNLRKSEKFSLAAGMLALLTSGLYKDLTSLATIGIPLNTILSSVNYYEAIKTNKERKVTEKESKTLKKIKLYFSYLMITLNIGLNITNLKVNYDEIQRGITYLKTSIVKDFYSMNNPFSEENKHLLVTTDDAKINILMEAFDKNPYINDEDLEIALTLKEYLEENPYADYEELYEVFSTLQINHSKNYDDEFAAGIYIRDLNTIEMFKDSYKSEEIYEDILQHEIIHSTGHLDNTLLNEGMSTLLQAEFSNDSTINNSYYDHVLVTKIFCELITPEKMLEAYTKQDMQIIKEEMLKLNPNEEDYNNLMDEIQQYSEEYEKRHWSFISNPYISQEDTPSYQLHELLNPYLNSDKIDMDTKEEILYYIDEIGYWTNVDSRLYFNKENDLPAYSNTQK